MYQVCEVWVTGYQRSSDARALSQGHEELVLGVGRRALR